jgi:hypothetical protein
VGGQDGSTTVHIADLDITSNNIAGIIITASSDNAGELVSDNEEEIPYTIAIVNDGTGTPTSTTSVSSLNQNVVGGFNSQSGIKSMDLYIKYSVVGLKKGDYSDTLTITVSDND